MTTRAWYPDSAAPRPRTAGFVMSMYATDVDMLTRVPRDCVYPPCTCHVRMFPNMLWSICCQEAPANGDQERPGRAEFQLSCTPEVEPAPTPYVSPAVRE